MASPQRLEAADRVTLLMSFVPYLIDQGPVSVTQLAHHFSITTSQVEELVQLLAMSGVPGDNGYYQHQDLFDINWDLFEEQHIVELWQYVAVEATPRFSAREAAALLAGLQYISGIIPESEKDTVQKLVEKISLGASAKPENLQISPAPVPVDLGIIRSAVQSAHSVEFIYHSSTGIQQQRRVDPLRLDLVGESWYLRAWCHQREALRTFRLDRISELSVSQHKIITTVTENDLSDELFEVSDTDVRVRFRIEDSALPLISGYRPEVISRNGDATLEIEVAFSDLSSVPIFVAQVPGSITVVSPQTAQEIVHQWASQALVSYNA